MLNQLSQTPKHHQTPQPQSGIADTRHPLAQFRETEKWYGDSGFPINVFRLDRWEADRADLASDSGIG